MRKIAILLVFSMMFSFFCVPVISASSEIVGSVLEMEDEQANISGINEF